MKTYFKTAWRSLIANKTYALINIGGLAVSLAACILLLLWAQDELSFDRFHKNANDIYKAAATFRNNDKTEVWRTSAPLAVRGKQTIPEIADACRVSPFWSANKLSYKEKKFFGMRCGLADPSFFSIFSFPLSDGNKDKPFPDRQSVILSKTTARKFFGDEAPLGKTIRMNENDIFRVTGVMKDMPDNSSISFDLVFPFSLLEKNYDGTGYWKHLDEDWGNYSYDTYFLIRDRANVPAAEKKLTVLHQKSQEGDFTKSLRYVLQPLTGIHLYSADGGDSDMTTVKIFLLIAVIILVIACINYVNLVTARAVKRAKEISLRKINGAGTGQLFLQFMVESLVLILLALAISTVLIYITLPLYNEIAGKHLRLNLFSGQVLLTYLFSLLATLGLAGIYPALSLIRFSPVNVLRGKTTAIGKNVTVRKILVIVQFTFSVILVVTTIVLSKQLRYVREKNLGFDKENILAFQLYNMTSHFDAIRAELLKEPGVTGVTWADDDIMNSYSSTSDVEWDGKLPSQSSFMINQDAVDRNFLKVMSIKLKEGSGFTGTPADSIHFILNEAAIKEMGIKNPLGKRLKFHDKEGTITGVVADFHFQNLHNRIRPIMLFYDPQRMAGMYVKTTGRNASRTISVLSKMWKQYNGDLPFEYKFLDERFDEMYRTDIRLGMLFNTFAVIAILISCLGLFGLVTYTAESKVKEIGIRKTLGAGIADIVEMLSKDFLVLVLISFAISFPLAWLGLSKLLQFYAYHTDLNAWPFIAAAATTVFIAMLTISFKALRAAMANPVKSLRTE